MKAVVQRVKEAKVEVENKNVGNISNGLVVLIGITQTDNSQIIDWFVNKIINLRVFSDNDGKLNLSVKDINGEILLVPNFTIYGDAKKGYRPSYVMAAKSEISESIFNEFYDKLNQAMPKKIQKGIFGADMQVSLVNDGPVTLVIEKEISEKE
jgi:D-tyrosyl-tRNA(Tyr) deacylase